MANQGYSCTRAGALPNARKKQSQLLVQFGDIATHESTTALSSLHRLEDAKMYFPFHYHPSEPWNLTFV